MADYILQYRRRSRHHCPTNGPSILLIGSQANEYFVEIFVLYIAIAAVQLLLGDGSHLASGGGEWWISEGHRKNLNFTIRRPSWITIQKPNWVIVQKRY
jgi:hypothetical protein